MSKHYEKQLLSKGIQNLAADGVAFDILQKEEDLYPIDDLKEVYNDTP